MKKMEKSKKKSKSKGSKPPWIEEATKNEGGLHKSLGVPMGEPIPKGKVEEAATKKGKVGKQARLAKNLAALSKKKGKGKK